MDRARAPTKTRHNKVAANNLVQTMDHPGITHWCNYEWNYVECSQSTTNVPSKAVPLLSPQSHSNPEPHSGLIRHWYAGDAASSSFGQSPDADLPLRAVDAERQSPVNDQSFKQNLLPWPQPKSNAELNSILIPYGGTNYEALTTGAALATQRLGEPHSKPRQKSGRCVRCWALRKPVILFI